MNAEIIALIAVCIALIALVLSVIVLFIVKSVLSQSIEPLILKDEPEERE
jgi:hypothetical protein